MFLNLKKKLFKIVTFNNVKTVTSTNCATRVLINISYSRTFKAKRLVVQRELDNHIYIV